MQYRYHAYLNSTGYSIAAQGYIEALLHVNPDMDIKIVKMNNVTNVGISQKKQEFLSSLVNKAKSEPYINIFHTIPHKYIKDEKAQKNVGVCLFETMNPNEKWITNMNKMDSIITASMFNKRVFETSGCIRPISVVPHTFDNKMFHENVSNNGRFNMITFLSIGTFKQRKNWEQLVKAFYDGFSTKDNVCLLLKTDKPKELENAIRRIKINHEWRSKNTAPIYVEPESHMNFEDIPIFMKKGDIYVCCSLGEGFGFGGFHAMALGIPVILPKFGGITEYSYENNCTFITPSGYKTYPTMDGIPQFSNCIWPTFKISDIRDAMISVSKVKPVQKTSEAYKYVHSYFNYNVIGNKFLEALN